MAESYSVEAVLSARDEGFMAGMKAAEKASSSLGSKVKAGLGFGVFSAIGSKAVGTVATGVTGLIGEMNSSSAAWKTFNGNMKTFGKESQIPKVRKELQSFAEQTIYSSSDMASTYAQLAAVGVKSADKLVMGFGGLASAAENPTQAMKTLSQQATQMAAKPKVQWQDFKLMLEQTPAGIAAVAKSMGKTTSQLVSDVQAGKVSTEDFFVAIEKVGNSKGFKEQARQYKTAGQAMDGLKETMANKLLPTFEMVSDVTIKEIGGVVDSIGKIDGDKLATKVAAGMKAATPYFNMFKSAVKGVGSVIKTVGGFLLDHSTTIAKVIPYVAGLVGAYKAFKIVKTFVPAVQGFTKAITGLTGKGIGGIAGKLFKIGKAEEEVGKKSSVSSKQMLASAKAFMMVGVGVAFVSAGFALLAYSAISLAKAGPLAIGVMVGLVGAVAALGAGMTVMINAIKPAPARLKAISTAMLAVGAAVLLVSAGFALMSYSAISLANSGGLAIGVMVGMVAAIAGLAAGAAALGPSLTAGAVGFIAFGAAIVLVGAGAVLASTAMYILAGVLPTISQYGLSSAVAITALAGGMALFSVGATLAGASCVVLGAGLVVVGAGAVVAAAGVTLLATGAILLGTGLAIAAVSLAVISSSLLVIGTAATTAATGFTALGVATLSLSAGLILVSSGLTVTGASALVATAGIVAFGAGMTVGAVGTLAMAAALELVKSSMKSINSSAKSAQASLQGMQSSVKLVESGLNALGSKAQSAMNKVMTAFNNTASKSKTAGKKVGDGFSNGMKSGLNKAPSIAHSAVSKSVSRMKSGYSGAYSAGSYIGQGLANGMRSQLGAVQSVAAQLAAAAEKAIRAKAKIHSPSKVSKKLGIYWGEGIGNGMYSMIDFVRKASEKLINIPNVHGPKMQLAGMYGVSELSDDYNYTKDVRFTVNVPLEIDGKEFARATADDMQEEQNRRQTRSRRKRGFR